MNGLRLIKGGKTQRHAPSQESADKAAHDLNTKFSQLVEERIRRSAAGEHSGLLLVEIDARWRKYIRAKRNEFPWIGRRIEDRMLLYYNKERMHTIYLTHLIEQPRLQREYLRILAIALLASIKLTALIAILL